MFPESVGRGGGAVTEQATPSEAVASPQEVVACWWMGRVWLVGTEGLFLQATVSRCGVHGMLRILSDKMLERGLR